MKVLVIEDDKLQANFLGWKLKKTIKDISSIKYAFTYEEANNRLETESYDLIISDLKLSGRETYEDLIQTVSTKSKQAKVLYSSSRILTSKLNKKIMSSGAKMIIKDIHFNTHLTNYLNNINFIA